MYNQFEPHRDTLLENAAELVYSGIPVIHLHSIRPDGECSCPNHSCSKVIQSTGEITDNAGKHPINSSWSKQPALETEAQKESFFQMFESFAQPVITGVGAVLPDDIIIVDVDCKEGKQGLSSFKKLQRDIGTDLEDLCGYCVISGSGKPSAHYWFKKPPEMEVRKTLKAYPDIDFLHKGNYVVIEGSTHKTGGFYEARSAKDSINNITQAPASLLDVIEKKAKVFESSVNAEAGECDINEIRDALSYIMDAHQGSVPYEDWFRICMGLHFETSGSQEGYELFDSWSSEGANYSGSGDTYKKWMEGSKESASKISGATILYMAQELGWEREYGVEVDLSTFIDSLRKAPKEKIVSKDGVELKFGDLPEELHMFKGAAGTLLQWSLENSRKPSVLISMSSMLFTLSVILGRDFRTDTESYASLYQMVVARTGRGKEQPMKVFSRCSKKLQDKFPKEKSTLMTDATSSSAMVSELEMQPRKGVVLDEIGHILEATAKIKTNANAIGLSKFYMEVFGRLGETYIPQSMSRRGLSKEDRQKLAEEKDDIMRPAVSIIGMTTPVKFMESLTRDMMQDGFINRFLVWFPQEGRQAIKLDMTNPIPEVFWDWAERVYIELMKVNGKTKETLVRDDPLNPLTPVTIKVRGTESEAIWREFEQYCWGESEKLERFGFEDIYERAPEIAMRVALILNLADNPMNGEMTEYSMKQAVALVKFAKSEEAKAYKLDFAENAIEKREKLIYNTISSYGADGISVADLFSDRCCNGLKTVERDDMLKSLLAKHSIVIDDTNEGKGRPSNKKRFVYSTEFKDYEED